MQFELATAQRIVFGRGASERLGELAAEFGRRALLVAGRHFERDGTLGRLEHLLEKRGLAVETCLVHGEPEEAAVEGAAACARQAGCEVVVAVGGGSTLDTAKAAAGLATNGVRIRPFLEGVGDGRPLTRAALPLIAAPTTAGTGSEVTKNAVVSSRADGFKKSVRSHFLLPAVAVVDPSLSDRLPPDQTAATGLDALTQLVEPYVSLRAQPVTDAMALEGVRLAWAALPRAFENGADQAARDDLALAALLGGLCLANAGLGAVHGIAAALGARFDVPHGFACASVLAETVDENVRALETRDPSSPALARYARLGELLAGRPLSDPPDARRALVEALRALTVRLKVPRLGLFEVRAADIPSLARESRSSSMASNPARLEDAEIAGVLSRSL